MTDFTGLVALITGGASGIGAATAAELVSRGARVAVLDRDTANAAADVLAITCDVTDPAQVRSAVAQVADELGGIDVVVNNAGIGASGTVADNDDDEWAHVLDVNVIAMARVAREALPHLERSSHAAIVNVSSAVAYVGVPNRALYGASKGAIVGLTLAMAADHVRAGIRVNAVAPGTADTPWVGRLLDQADDPDAAAEALRGRQPIGRLVRPGEVAKAIAYLASPLSGSTTGTILRVDGGMSSLRV
ncbi:NAD(P)-dependent dehydrogenase, short-chain alcohol dehydrogenase family [Microbacterium sp. cf046]|uniref:SDR family NAD(P)-dependent oxidoreductase n=1 Tax=Microbacterium sp. cf046 TaxID=1761803 RepID=UPI0008F119A7|nr:SDR family oxidoreductase [Microbacterium sp. cf046]SFR94929.1 NAD(P)-dependent dehydrogenase, short-chain alcohol dehydrogenase family [Microbacterium sp. cf046]